MDYSFIRKDFNLNSISKNILSIQISLDGFSFVICPADNPKSPDYIYIKRIPPGENLIDDLASFTGFDSMKFHVIRIMFHEAVFTLVPTGLFDLRDKKTYLNLNHPPYFNRKVLSNEIRIAGAVCVFAVDEYLYRLLKKKFPDAEFCHTSLPFCSTALNKAQDGCFIQVYEKTMELAVVKNHKLSAYNIYDIQGENDIIYYTANAYKAENLNTLTYPLFVSGILLKNSETFFTLSKYIRDIRFYLNGFIVASDAGEFQYPSHYFLNHREIVNCEL